MCRSWGTGALQTRWFDGHVLSHESKRYIDNFLAVTRTRPDDEEEVLSDVELSDEELHVSAQNFAECVKTRMGKGPRTNAGDSTLRGDDDQDAEDDVLPTTQEAFDLARSTWQIRTPDTGTT